MSASSGPTWHKAHASGGADNCVEVAFHEGRVLVRNSKVPTGHVLSYTVDEWNAFLDGATRGEFALDRLEDSDDV